MDSYFVFMGNQAHGLYLDVYKPILQEVEKILEEAGLDADEMKKVAGGAGSSAAGTSRNRR